MAQKQLNLMKKILKEANDTDEQKITKLQKGKKDQNLKRVLEAAIKTRKNISKDAITWENLKLKIDQFVFNSTDGQYKIQRKRVAAICDLAVICYDKIPESKMEEIKNRTYLEAGHELSLINLYNPTAREI
ncbi:MAG: hypothetical protein NkDv07_0119 [Candidatus Improbicoccus devescovinae]|nr:MAG: hypothetical protein NkDv07_0119 [Candidatus Improbicoccus devescovinae]